MKQLLLIIGIFFIAYHAQAQNMGKISGVVVDKNTQQALADADITLISNDTLYTFADENGRFLIETEVGNYSLSVGYFGYQTNTLYNINVSSGNAQILRIELEEDNQLLNELVINTAKSVKATDMVTPLATQKLTSEEIKANPGGNFDVSKVIQVLPGVAGGTTANRNDIIVRGGGPSENVYYLDGIEIPVLNHFQTQGASGGATGILNVSFIQDVQLTSSAFDSKYGNALASTFIIKQRNGNPEKLAGNLRLSGTEFAAMLEGPLSKKTTFMASARRSYLQFLFKLLDLPIRPDYYDFQYKVNHQLDEKTELNFIGIGAIDNFTLAVPDNSDANKAYINRANPLIKQWNYTIGASLKRLVNDGYYTIALSRNMFYNSADRYENNATKSGEKLFALSSHETENKLRFDMNKYQNGWKYSYGTDVQYAQYDADVYKNNLTQNNNALQTSTAIDFVKMGAYGHVSRYILNDRLLISGGIRTDINTFTTEGDNPLKTLSPRLSFSYSLVDKWNISASVGSYYKLPVYTMLGYKNTNNQLINKSLDYINSFHYTIGTQFIPSDDLRFTVEAFYKDYNDYPVSASDGISFANIGTDFETVGGQEYSSIGKGRVYGIEAYVQQKLVKKLFYVASATFYKSEFTGSDGQYFPSTWDYGFVISATMGYKFDKNWDIGLKYRIAGGQPYTPFDIAASTANYLSTGKGTYNYALLNQERLAFFQQLDLRIDKKFNFKKTSLNLFLDFQNVFLYKTATLPKFTFERTDDNTDFKTTDGQPIRNDGSNAIPYILEDREATIVPSIGFIFEF